MPRCFRLLEKGTQTAKSLNSIDTEICEKVLHVEVHPKWYGGGEFNWFDTIGLLLACGKSLNPESDDYILKDETYGETFVKVVNYLSERYDSDSFYQY